MGENVVLVYLVVCFFVFLAGFVDSIAGGGGLISLPAYMIAGTAGTYCQLQQIK